MDRPEKQRQRGKSGKAGGDATPGHFVNPPPNPQAPTIPQALGDAVQHFNHGDLAQAEGICRRIVQADPNHHDALHLLGVISHTAGKNDAAVEFITKALAIKPDFAQAHNNLGSAFNALGKPNEAAASFRMAVSIKPDFAEAYFNLGNALQELKELEEAAASHHKALAINPNFAGAHKNLSMVLKALNRLDEAVVSCRRVVSIEPDSAKAHYNLGLVLHELGDLDASAASYRKALALQPDYAEAHNNLGIVLNDQGKFEDAVACFQEAVSIRPDYSDFKINLKGAMSRRVEHYIRTLNRPGQARSLSSNRMLSENARGRALAVNLVYCPFVDPITPPLGMASLKAYLEKYGDTQVHCMDLNLEWHANTAKDEQAGMESLRNGERLFQGADENFFDVDQYKKISRDFIDCLNETHDHLQYSLCRDTPPQDNNFLSYLKPLALKGNPDVVGFSLLFSGQVLSSLLLAREIKRTNPETIVVFGGAGMLSFGKEIIENPAVDFVVFEAGEASFKELLDCIKTGQFNESIPGVAFKQDGKGIINKAIPGNLNHGAYPDFSEYPMDKYFTKNVVIPILSSKGCFWRRCSFCEEGSINQYATATVDRVVDEIENHSSDGYRYFQFVDEMITPDRLRLISDEIIRRKLKVFFYGTLRPSADFNFETLQLMHQAGWRYVIWGVESCNPRLLKLVRKGTSLKTVHSTLDASRRAGIRNHIFMIFGFPSETPGELFETMKFIYENQESIHQVHAGTFVLYEGTEIFSNPDKFEIEIEYRGEDRRDFKVKHRDGTTGEKAEKYYIYYRASFLDKFSYAPAFGKLRDHALLHYIQTPLEDYEKVRERIPLPAPAEFSQLE